MLSNYELHNGLLIPIKTEDLKKTQVLIHSIDELAQKNKLDSLENSGTIIGFYAMNMMEDEGYNIKNLQENVEELNSGLSIYYFTTLTVKNLHHPLENGQIEFFASSYVIFRAIDYEKLRENPDKKYLSPLEAISISLSNTFKSMQLQTQTSIQ